MSIVQDIMDVAGPFADRDAADSEWFPRENVDDLMRHRYRWSDVGPAPEASPTSAFRGCPASTVLAAIGSGPCVPCGRGTIETARV